MRIPGPACNPWERPRAAAYALRLRDARDPDILAAATGRTDVEVLPTLSGYRAVAYPGRSYPALAPAAGASATGLLLIDLSAADLAALDAFEAGEYRRSPVSAETAGGSVLAQAYLPVADIDPEAPEWTLEGWTARHKAAMLSSELGHRPRPP